MRRMLIPAVGLVVALPLLAGSAQAGPAPLPLSDAGLIIETNATDGDAGLQVFADGTAWRALSVYAPDGHKIVDVRTKGDLGDYGLTELFSESSEPPFTEFPFEEFKALFPEGTYRFVATTIEGDRMEGTAALTHAVPDAPVILSPEGDSTVAPFDLMVRWEPVDPPAGTEIVGYQVIVVRDDGSAEFSADLPPTATSIVVPPEFVEAGTEYKAEVLAIEASGNQTLSEIAFSTG